MSLYLTITAILGLSGVAFTVLTLAFYTPFGEARRIRVGPHGTAAAKQFIPNAIGNAIFSLGLVYLFTWLSLPTVFHFDGAGPARVIGEGVAILLVYDFLYYFLHRFGFHQWTPLKKVHAVHHVIRNTTAVDSLYLHPVETFFGIGLLYLCTAIVAAVAGPISLVGFAWVFLVHTMLNIVVHSGIRFQTFPFTIFTYYAVRHDKHHVNMAGQNFASLTPFWDKMFGTEEV